MAFSEIMHNTIRTLFTGILLLPVLNSAAQIDYEQPAPLDPDIRTGRLDNGLTYFIRHIKNLKKGQAFTSYKMQGQYWRMMIRMAWLIS
jgi:hypothetical protein